MSWLSNLLNPGNAYKQAGNQYQNYFNQAQGYMQPFMQQGQAAGQQLSPALAALLNPEELQSKWASGYEESPYAKQLLKEATDQGMGTASGMGLMGSSAALQNIQTGNMNIMNQDRQKYMQDLMEKYMGGIGLGQNLYGAGANAANQMGQNSMNAGNTMAGLNFGQNQAGANMLGNILGGIGGLGLNYFTGGMGQGSFGRGMFQPTWMNNQGGY